MSQQSKRELNAYARNSSPPSSESPTSLTPTFTHPPPTCPTYLLSYPTPHILLITINRPKAMNSLPYASHWEADALLSWYDSEPSLRVAIVTGAGDKAFCAGQDLIEQRVLRDAEAKALERSQSGKGEVQGGSGYPPRQMLTHPVSGFMGISRRMGKKPIIAAVNGFAMGGGFEICLGCDLLVASPTATFGLPEATRGLYAAAGGLSRLVRIVGLPLATEISMTDRRLSADEALQFQVINRVSKTPESLLPEAIEMARKVAESISPDAAIVTRHGLRMALEYASVERAAQVTEQRYGDSLRATENIREGLRAFGEKRKPQWLSSKL